LVHVRKETKHLSHIDCRELESACIHARTLGHRLNTHITYAPWSGSRVNADARAADFNRLKTHLSTLARRWGLPWAAIWVWHANANGREPHVHVFMHCPKKHRDELRDRLSSIYPGDIIEVREGSDIPKWHPSGNLGSTVYYISRHKTPQANYRHRMKGIKTPWDRSPCPIEGKRWGCSRNLSPRAVSEYFEAKRQHVSAKTGT